MMDRKKIFTILFFSGFVLFVIGHSILPFPIPLFFGLKVSLGFAIGFVMMMVFSVLYLRDVQLEDQPKEKDNDSRV